MAAKKALLPADGHALDAAREVVSALDGLRGALEVVGGEGALGVLDALDGDAVAGVEPRDEPALEVVGARVGAQERPLRAVTLAAAFGGAAGRQLAPSSGTAAR